MTTPETEEFPMGESMETFTAEVRDTAYFLWEQDGRPLGKADEYWYRALDQHIRARVNAEAMANNAPRVGPDTPSD